MSAGAIDFSSTAAAIAVTGGPDRKGNPDIRHLPVRALRLDSRGIPEEIAGRFGQDHIGLRGAGAIPPVELVRQDSVGAGRLVWATVRVPADRVEVVRRQ